MLFNRFGLTNGQMDEFLSLVAARALELEDVLTKANGIVRDFLVQFHHERHPDMTRPPQLHAESHEVQRRTSSEEELKPWRRERNTVYADRWHRKQSFVNKFRRRQRHPCSPTRPCR
jgi:hypothetical protein